MGRPIRLILFNTPTVSNKRTLQRIVADARFAHSAQYTQPSKRARRRNAESRPILDKLQAWARLQTGLPKGGLRKAVEYMLSRWQALTVFLDNPLVEIHNNGTERALRGMVLGRKNHYGSRSKRGTEVAAILYSLIESAKLCGVDPQAYLRRLAEMAIAEPGTVLLPHDSTE